MLKVPPRVAAVALQNKLSFKLSFWPEFTRNAKNGIECLKPILSGTFAILTLNLCGFDPGLEAGSRLPIKSNLVFNLSSALKRYHAYVCQTTYKRLKNRLISKGF